MSKKSNLLLVLVLFTTLALAETPMATRLSVEEDLCIGAWFLGVDALEWEGARSYLDCFADHSPYNLITTSFRWEPEVTEDRVHDLMQQAVAYAHERGLKISLDLDIRLARRAFQAAHPNEQQEMIRFQRVALEGDYPLELTIKARPMTDHMTGGTIPYIALASRLGKVYSFVEGEQGVQAGSLKEITAQCKVLEATDTQLRVSIPPESGRVACVGAVFSHLTPAVFAPHFDTFQRSIVEQYADIPLDGIMKDEWGFPPYHPKDIPEHKDFWHSAWLSDHYADRSGGRDYFDDCFLMYQAVQGQKGERQAAINLIHTIKYEKNVAIEQRFYDLGKEFFGPKALITTHPTWHSEPQATEYKKHGMDWWAAKRDFAQCDERTPYPVRSALAKKWPDASACYNQYYSPKYNDYVREIWQGAATGNRLNYHPIYPNPKKLPRYERYASLLQGDLMRAESRLRLLELVSQSPLHCPVAVVFGHACAGNWAGPAYNDLGVKMAHALWEKGCYADLIPTTEIYNGALKVNEAGRVAYGPQEYEAVILYHPEFEAPQTASFFTEAAASDCFLLRVGEWTQGPLAQAYEGNAALPAGMQSCSEIFDAVALILKAVKSPLQTPAPEGKPALCAKHYRIDGTCVLSAGSDKSPAGETIQEDFQCNGHTLSIQAAGIAAVRLSPQGDLEALAAGGLTRLQGPNGLDIRLPEGVDLAYWHDASGKPQGLLQGWEGAVPEVLVALCKEWRRVALPEVAP